MNLEPYLIIYFILTVIAWLIFIKMAINIGIIRKTVEEQKPLWEYQAELAEFKGQKEKALDLYMNVLFDRVNSDTTDISKNQRKVLETIKKIESLGGSIPKGTRKQIKQLMDV